LHNVHPLIAALSIGTPGLSADRALDSLRAIARVVPVLLVSAAYVHATPVRDTRAAVQRTVPGRAGQLLGTGIGLTFRYVPVVRADLRTVRDAVAARGGDERPFHERVARITTLVLARTLDRSDQLSVALQARCFAWNPTLPGLAFTRPDYPALGAAAVLIALPFLPL
jgi:biotin transport system permease protein